MVGKRIRHYRIEEEIGSGGMGRVFQAFDTRLDRRVAIKILPGDQVRDQGETLLREARAAGGIDHPNVATIHEADFDPDLGIHYIVMEWIDGKNLRQLRQERVSEERWLSIGAAVADGLAKAHGRGIIHHDIKPDNVMVTSDGFVKILDFGLARSLEDRGAGELMGIPAYIPPERLAGEEATPRSDVYALAVLLYHMLSGRLPFEGETDAEVLAAVEAGRFTPLDRANPEVSPEAVAVIHRALALRPEDRYPDAASFARALRAVVDGERSRRPHWGARVAILAALASVAAVGYAIWLGNPPAPPPVPAGAPEAKVERRVFPVALACEVVPESEPDARLAGLVAVALRTSLESLPRYVRIAADAPFRITARAIDAAEIEIDLSLEAPDGRRTWTVKEPDFARAVDQAASLILEALEIPLPQGFGIASVLTGSREALAEYLAGDEALRDGRYAEAAGRFREAFAAAPDFAGAYYGLFLADHWRSPAGGKPESITEAYRLRGRATQRLARKIEGYYAMRAQGRFVDALPLFQEALAEAPADLDARLGLLECLATGYLTSDFFAAREIASTFPDPPLPVRRWLAPVLARAKDLEGARRLVAGLEASDGEFIDLWRAQVEAAGGDAGGFNRALATFFALSTDGPWTALARIGYLREDRAAALRLEGRAERSAPVTLAFADLHLWSGDFRAAIERIDRAQTEPSFPIAGWSPSLADRLAAAILIVIGDRDGAQARLRRAWQRSVGDPVIAFELEGPLEPAPKVEGYKKDLLDAIAAWRGSEGKACLDHLESMAPLFEDPRDFGTLDLLPRWRWARAALLREAGDLDAARREYESLVAAPIRLFPDDAGTIRILSRYRLGEVQEALGDTRRARAAYESFLSCWGKVVLPEGPYRVPPEVERAAERVKELPTVSP
ncbi:MAG: protein kinase [Planctomycetes bacterium]|nr:protein kinase [Planctomycetota bacterium]